MEFQVRKKKVGIVTDIYCFRHIGDSIQQVFERYSWTKAVLAYRPTDHMEWSGDLSCQQFMASGMF